MANEMMNRRHDDMFDAMNDWFNFPRNFFDNDRIANIMQSDVTEDDKEYTIKADMPGMNKKDIQLSYKDGILNISANRKTENKEEDKDHNFIRQERAEGRISRSFRLPNVEAQNIHAKYDNGVLTITLPKQTQSENGNSIEID